MSKNGFQGKVLTHLEYIKKKQDEHDKRFDKIEERLDKGASKISSLKAWRLAHSVGFAIVFTALGYLIFGQ